MVAAVQGCRISGLPHFRVAAFRVDIEIHGT